MNKEDIIRMAKECGDWSGQTIEMNDVGLEMFAKLVRAAIEQEPKVTWDASAPLVVHPHPAFKKWQGLTDEEITEIAATPAAIPGSYVFSFARAIEAKLKEKNT